MTAALRSKRSLVAARAARLIKEHAVGGMEAEVRAMFDRFVAQGPKSDPQCQAKLAAIEALDYAESIDPAPFLRATEIVQHDPYDSAGGVRARGLMALARLGAADFDLVAARLLTDALPMVRQAALDALVHRGDRSFAALALYKLRLGDEDPLVTLAAMTALLALAPGCALAELGALLDGDGERRELAAVALGQSRNDEALSRLLDAIERCPRADQRRPLYAAVGLHRSDRALAALLAIVAERAEADARAALEALAPRRFEPGVSARVRAAAARNSRAVAVAADEQFAK